MNVIPIRLLSCEAVRGLLDAFVDGELVSAEHGPVVSHLGSCRRCQAVVESARRSKHAVARALRRQPATLRLRERVIREIRHGGSTLEHRPGGVPA